MSDSDSDIWDSDLEDQDMNSDFPIQDIFTDNDFSNATEFFTSTLAKGLDILEFIRKNSTYWSTGTIFRHN